MSKKLYSDGEIVATEDVHREHMKFFELPQLKLELQKLDRGIGYFYCRAYGEVGDSSYGTCGKQCKDYKPRNGVSGCCKHHRGTYSGTGIFKIIYNETEVTNET